MGGREGGREGGEVGREGVMEGRGGREGKEGREGGRRWEGGRGTLSITGPQANMGPCRYLLPPTTYFKTKLHSILLVPVDGGLVT